MNNELMTLYYAILELGARVNKIERKGEAYIIYLGCPRLITGKPYPKHGFVTLTPTV